MVNKFEDAIKISIRSYTRARAALPKKLGNEAVNFFKDSWRKQGWDSNGTMPWKPRKRETKSSIGRAILVGKGSGVLRRSFDYYPTQNRIIVINDRHYGVYHNYGTKRLPKRKFMGKSATLDYKSGVMISRMIKGALR